MDTKKSDVTILCRVVDNYGDIGFVYRLARSISARRPDIHIRLIVSSLESFSKIAPGIDPSAPVQEYRSWKVLDWNASDVCRSEYRKNPPGLILECFQCSRPEWLDEILFDPGRTEIVQIINIEYLSAEPWADDVHLLKSGTRSALVKKVNFMPGFTPRTGGLVLDPDFVSSLSSKNAALNRLRGCSVFDGIQKAVLCPDTECITLFTYRRDFTPLVHALKMHREQMSRMNPSFSLCIFAAPGQSLEPFLEACKKEGDPFTVIPLPYLAQESWDALLTLSDINIVRGEDSFARACLCGKPFLWNAYVQDDEFQLNKVNALLDRMEIHFAGSQEFFARYRTLMIEFNRTTDADAKKIEAETEAFLQSCAESAECFSGWGNSLMENGDLTQHLLEFIRKV